MAEPIRNPVFMPLLPAGQTWTMTSQNRLTGTLIRRVRAEIYCTTAGTLYVEESDDQAFGASTTLATITVAASTTPTADWVKLSKKWWRLRYVNGGAAQTSLAELWLEKDYRDVQDVEVTGSIPAGTNNIGDVDVLTLGGQTPAFANTNQLVTTLKNAGGSLINSAQGNSDAVAANLDALAVFAYLGGFDGTNWARLRTVNTGQLVVTPKDSSGTEAFVGIGNDGLIASQYLLHSAARQHAYNNSTYDRWRNNTEGTLLVSAARTATATSVATVNYNGGAIGCFLNVTAKAAATTLTISLLMLDPVSGSTKAIASVSAIPAAVGQYLVQFGPGTIAADLAANSYGKGVDVPRQFLLESTPSDANSVTYSIGYSLTVA